MTAAPPTVALRSLRSDDVARVEAMTRAAGLFREEEIPVALEVFEATARGRDTYEGLGADSAGSLVAWAAWGPTPGTLGTFDLYWIVVDPAWQSGGIGTALLLEMERLVTGRARMIVVETAGRPDYAGTRAFYERRGYQAVAVIPDFYAPGDDQVTYIKTLA